MIETECGLLRLRGEDDDGRRGADGGASLVAQAAAEDFVAHAQAADVMMSNAPTTRSCLSGHDYVPVLRGSFGQRQLYTARNAVRC